MCPWHASKASSFLQHQSKTPLVWTLSTLLTCGVSISQVPCQARDNPDRLSLDPRNPRPRRALSLWPTSIYNSLFSTILRVTWCIVSVSGWKINWCTDEMWQQDSLYLCLGQSLSPSRLNWFKVDPSKGRRTLSRKGIIFGVIWILGIIVFTCKNNPI